jgi:formate dehydrogenase major subunit
MTYQRQDDFGTPESRSEDLMTLTIDGRQVTVPAAPA